MRKPTLISLALILLALTAFCGRTYEKDRWFHPVFSQAGWVYLQSVENYITDPDGAKVLWRKISYYKHSDEYWLKSEHVIFGEFVLRALGVNDKSGKVLEHWIQVENGGIWYAARAGKDSCSLWNNIKDPLGKIIAVEITLVDEESGKEVVRRIVKRKF